MHGNDGPQRTTQIKGEEMHEDEEREKFKRNITRSPEGQRIYRVELLEKVT